MYWKRFTAFSATLTFKFVSLQGLGLETATGELTQAGHKHTGNHLFVNNLSDVFFRNLTVSRTAMFFQMFDNLKQRLMTVQEVMFFICCFSF